MWDNPKNCVVKRHFFLSIKKPTQKFKCGKTTIYVWYNDFFFRFKKKIGNFFHEKLNFCVVKQQSICVKTLSPIFIEI